MLPVGASKIDEDRMLARMRAAEETGERKYIDICSATELEPSYDSGPIREETLPIGTDVDYNYLWQSLATLAATFQHLSEFNYACTGPFPSCMLDALRVHQPYCRIHLHSFRFQSLHHTGIHPSDLRLLQSPSVKTVSVQHSVCDRNGQEDYTVEAMREAIQIAPNVENIRIQSCRISSRSARARKSQLTSQRTRKAYVSHLEHTLRRATPLTFCAQSEIDFPWEMWTEAVDMSQLQTLNLGRIRKPGTLNMLSRSTNLASLERLALKFELPETLDTQVEVESFFETLSPLQVLRLHGMVNLSVLNTILERHGSTLREFLIDSYSLDSGQPRPLIVTAAVIRQLSTQCPWLKELELTVPRSWGDQREASCYHELGKLHSLEKLCLHLDCSIPRTELRNREDLGGFDSMPYTNNLSPPEQICNRDIGDLLINAAIDENLARSIWKYITSGHKRPSSLQWLRVSPQKGGYLGTFVPHGLQDMIEHMSRTFQLVKNGETVIDIIEVGCALRKQRDERWREIEAECSKRLERPLDDDILGVMRTIWPFQEGDDWRVCWSSFRLPRS